MPIAPGTRLGRYEVIAPIGAGGMGEVHRARDLTLGREVAVTGWAWPALIVTSVLAGLVAATYVRTGAPAGFRVTFDEGRIGEPVAVAIGLFRVEGKHVTSVNTGGPIVDGNGPGQRSVTPPVPEEQHHHAPYAQSDHQTARAPLHGP